MNVYKVHNLLILQPVLQKMVQYYVKGEHLALLFDDDYATL